MNSSSSYAEPKSTLATHEQKLVFSLVLAKFSSLCDLSSNNLHA